MFILNEYDARAWTFQEIAVAKEIEFMGMIGTLKEFSALVIASLHNDFDCVLSIKDIFYVAEYATKGFDDWKSANALFECIEKRTAFHAHDMFYAIFPVFDESLVKKNYLEIWDSIRDKYHKLLFNGYKRKRTIWIDPYWFGINNTNILQSYAKLAKMKACHKDDKIIINWTIADKKVHVIVDLLILKEHVEQDQKSESIWYFYNTIQDNNIIGGPFIYDGHIEETNEWKEHTFVWKTKTEQLHIRLISADNLYAADFGGTSDPYVKIYMNDKCYGVSSVISLFHEYSYYSKGHKKRSESRMA